MEWAALIVGGYVLGSIPFGVLIARARGVDVLAVGSGNPGATNVWRSAGPVAGLTVLLLDIGKGLAPSIIGRFVFHDPLLAFAGGFSATIGHLFSPFLRFKGGKGIATGYGMLIGTAPAVSLSVLGVFVLVLSIWRYVSLASLAAAAAMVLLAYAFDEPIALVGLFAIVAGLIFYKHRSNIDRLLKGTERRFEVKPKATDGGV